MHPVVLDVLAVEATLITEILLKLLVHVVSDRLPAVGTGCMRWAVRVAHQPQGGLVGLSRDCAPARPSSPLRVVDSVPEAWSIHNGELQLDALLFYVHRVLQDLDRLADALFRKGDVAWRGLPDPYPPPWAVRTRTLFSSILVFWPWPQSLWSGPFLLDPGQENHAVGREEQG